MRNLTIKRQKRFVACLGTMKVYIEDPTQNDLTIGGVACRFLGKVKNGEEQTFAIGEEEARVFVVADRLSKDYCNEFFRIPPGESDVYLSGRNHLNPAQGNPFRFDGEVDEEVLANRKKGMGKGIVILAVAVVVGLLIGTLIGNGIARAMLGSDEATPKTFTVEEMEITLTDAFTREESENMTAAFETGKVAVFVLREDSSLFEDFDALTVDDYGEMVITGNGKDASVTLQETDGLSWFTYGYENTELGRSYSYLAFVYRSEDAFWLVQFATLAEDLSEYRDECFAWAGSVQIGE